jgi:hypothetical protein
MWSADFDRGTHLTCPGGVFYADSGSFSTPSSFPFWQQRFRIVRRQMFHGGHFYLRSSAASGIDRLVQATSVSSPTSRSVRTLSARRDRVGHRGLRHESARRRAVDVDLDQSQLATELEYARFASSSSAGGLRVKLMFKLVVTASATGPIIARTSR